MHINITVVFSNLLFVKEWQCERNNEIGHLRLVSNTSIVLSQNFHSRRSRMTFRNCNAMLHKLSNKYESETTNAKRYTEELRN